MEYFSHAHYNKRFLLSKVILLYYKQMQNILRLVGKTMAVVLPTNLSMFLFLII